MIGAQSPAKTKRFRLGDDVTEPVSKIVPVLVIRKYPPAFSSANDNMMQRSGGIDSGFTGHASFVTQ